MQSSSLIVSTSPVTFQYLFFAEITYTYISITEMGWFDPTIDGIGSAVNWVTSNSGTISGVVNAVSTVASLLVATSPVDNAKGADTDTPPDLFVTFNQANQYLENEASYMLGKILPKHYFIIYCSSRLY